MKKNNKSIKKIFNIFLEILLFFFFSLFIFLLKKINIIPNKYFIILTFLMFIINIIFFLILQIKKKYKIINIIKYISYPLVIILILIYIMGSIYLLKSLNFINNIIGIKEEINNYYIITLKNSKYDDISDLYLANVAYYEGINKEVLDSIKLDFNYKILKDDESIIEYLYNNEIEAIIISDIIKNKYEDEDIEFEEKIKILKTICIKNKIEDITKKVTIKNTPFNVLISGIDTYGSINTNSRNDVNMIATINPNTNEILLTSIPRDYYVKLHGIEGYKDKLTHAAYYGINTQLQTIEDLLDIDINYYIKVNFTTVETLVDKIGGIEIYSDKYLSLGECYIKEGYNKVNGKCALRFARERKSYSGGDRHRVQNQQEVIRAIFKKMTTSSTLLTDFSNILSALDGKFSTSLDINESIEFLKYELNELNDYEFLSYQVDGEGSSDYTYSYPNQKLYVMIPYEDTVLEAHNKITELLNKKTK